MRQAGGFLWVRTRGRGLVDITDEVRHWLGFERLVPENAALYEHDDEGPDDMPAHLRAALTQVHLTIRVVDARLTLGTWQAIYLFEHRRRPQERRIALHVFGG
jgi:secondary thiamine-phosphate synthase enzyme